MRGRVPYRYGHTHVPRASQRLQLRNSYRALGLSADILHLSFRGRRLGQHLVQGLHLFARLVINGRGHEHELLGRVANLGSLPTTGSHFQLPKQEKRVHATIDLRQTL